MKGEEPKCKEQEPTFGRIVSATQLTNVSFLQGWRVIDTITSHGNDSTQVLAALNNDQLLLWGCPGKHDFRVLPEDFVDLLSVQFLLETKGKWVGPCLWKVLRKCKLYVCTLCSKYDYQTKLGRF